MPGFNDGPPMPMTDVLAPEPDGYRCRACWHINGDPAVTACEFCGSAEVETVTITACGVPGCADPRHHAATGDHIEVCDAN